MAIGDDGLPIIAYQDDATDDLKIFLCTNVACTTQDTIRTIDPAAADVGDGASLTIGHDGMAIIGYSDDTNFDLKVVHCSNVACVPFTRSS